MTVIFFAVYEAGYGSDFHIPGRFTESRFEYSEAGYGNILQFS
jgi:hypothetical protein